MKIKESYHSMIADVLLDVESGVMSAPEALTFLQSNGLDMDTDSSYMSDIRGAEDKYYGDAFDEYADL